MTATQTGPMISTNLRIVAIAGSLALLIFIIELVRRRHLKEEYSVLWVATALVLLLLAIWGGLLKDLAHMIGAGSEASALYFFGILFVVFLLLHFSVRVSNLERRVVVLLQEVALLNEREERRKAPVQSGEDPAADGTDHPRDTNADIGAKALSSPVGERSPTQGETRAFDYEEVAR